MNWKRHEKKQLQPDFLAFGWRERGEPQNILVMITGLPYMSRYAVRSFHGTY
jgi:hypothetical protein